MSFPRNIAALATVKSAIRPLAQAAAAAFSLEGETIDRGVQGFESALFFVAVGADEGTPDSFTVDAKLQEATTGSGDWTDVVADGINPAVAITQLTAENTQSFLAIDLSRLKVKVRLVFTIVFVNGASPKINLTAAAMLGGGVSIPPTHS